MKILGAKRDDPAFYYRVAAPFNVLSQTTEHDWLIRVPSLPMAKEYNVLWLQQHADYATYIVAYAFKNAGKLVVYDVDDFLFGLPPSWIDSEAFAPGTERLELHKMMLALADVVTTTTDYLADKLRGLLGPDKRIVVLPNCVYQADWDILLPQAHNLDRPVLGWFGTGNHWDDWVEIAPIVDKALEDVGAYLVLIGPQELVRCFPSQLVQRTYHQFNVPFNRFKTIREMIKTFDVGLCWATDRTEASKCRSPLKLFQYGAAGVPVVASRTVYGGIVDSPSGTGGVVYSDPDTLYDALVFVLRGHGLAGIVKESALRLRETVWREHSYEQCAHLWLDVL